MNTFRMRATVVMFTGLALAAIACKKDDPNAQTAANQQNGQYPQQQGQYPQQNGQYPQQQGQYPQQQGTAPQTGTMPPATGGTLATPGPLALPCSTDSACFLHKCNVPAGKCAFPCASDFDCNPGNKCNPGVGACFPG